MKKILAGLLILSCLFTGCNKKEDNKITLVLDYTPNTNHTGFYVAKELGYYKDAGLELEIIQPPEDGALALLAGKKTEFGVTYQEELITAIAAENPLPVTAVAALLVHNTGGIMSRKDKNITRFKDLEGKSYGSWSIPIYDEIIFDCVKSDGGDPSKVEMIPNKAVDIITGLQREFDATWVYEGWDKVIGDINGLETDFLAFRDINPVFDYYTPIIAANDTYIKENRDTAEKFLEATKKGFEYAAKNPEESAKILVKQAPEIDEEIAIKSQDYLKDKYFEGKWGEIDKTRWDNFTSWMNEKGLINTDKELVGFTNEYLK